MREHWPHEHTQLMRKIEGMCWTVEELRWLETHLDPDTTPREILQKIGVMLAEKGS
jgi:hypothetical protein